MLLIFERSSHLTLNIRKIDVPIYLHKVDRNRKCLSTMYMSEARWVRDNGLSNERIASDQVWPHTRLPTSLKHFGDHLSLLRDVTSSDGLHFWDDPRVLYHVLKSFQLMQESQRSKRRLTAINSVGSPPIG